MLGTEPIVSFADLPFSTLFIVANCSMSSSSSAKDLDRPSSKDQKIDDKKRPNDSVTPTTPELAVQGGQRMEGALGDAILRFLRIRKRPKNNGHDLDAVC